MTARACRQQLTSVIAHGNESVLKREVAFFSLSALPQQGDQGKRLTDRSG